MKKELTLGQRLRKYRERAGYHISEAAQLLGIRYGRLVSWENDNHKPDIDRVVTMSELYDVSVDELLDTNREFTLKVDESKIIDIYRSLPVSLKDLLMDIVRSIDMYNKKTEKRIRITPRPIYEQSASAGTGSFLDSTRYTMMEFPEEVVPNEATFGVRVSGDSMEPDYPDGSIVFVKQMKNLRPGDVGIFTLNGEGFIKEMGDNANLISRNKAYSDIEINEYDDLRVVGKVVGVYEE